MSGNVTFRDATAADAAAILGYIRALADIEGLAHEVVATEAQLREALFGPERSTYVTIAEVGGQAVGMALYFYNFSTFLGRRGIYLEDVYIEPAHRGSGIGTRLFAHMAQKVLDMGGGRLNWWVLDDNAPAVAFYDRIGAEPQSEWTVYKLEGETLRRVAALTAS